MRISGLSLVPVSVASVAVLFALSACGGGGGGTPGVNLPPPGGTPPPSDSIQRLESGALAVSVVPLPPLETLYEIAVAELSTTSSCPSVFVNTNGTIVLDFGSGCYNYDGLGRARGRVEATPVGGDSYRLRLVNFSWYDLPISVNGEGTINIANLSAAGEIRYALPTGCEVRFNLTQLSGTVSAGRIRAQGRYYSPASGEIAFSAEVTYSSGCDWPTGGNVSLSANNQTATVQFGPGCGEARYTVGGQTVTRNLDELFENILQVANPCGQ